MAVTINWATKVISVPKTFSTQTQPSPEIRELDLNLLRIALKDLEDNEVGINCLTTHNHNSEVTVGGVTLARVIEIINNYTITFEDGQYAINLVNANSNVSDVVNVNQVSVRSANSAGLIVSGSGVTAQDKIDIIDGIWNALNADYLTTGTTGKALADAGGAGNPWSSTVVGNTSTGTMGEVVGKKLLKTGTFIALK